MKLQPLVSLWLLIPYIIAAVSFAGWQLWRIRHKVQKHLRTRAVLLRWFRRTALLVLPAIIAIGPSIQGGISSPGVANLDVIFAVDTTPSMGALDYNGKNQRIEGAKRDLLALAETLKGAHMEIITFDSETSVILPLTTDFTAFSTAVEGMVPQINSYSQGSSVDKPIGLIIQELKASAAVYPEHYRILFYLGDGEQTTDLAPKAFNAIARQLDGGAVLGYGTTTGAQMVKYTGIYGATAAPAYITTIDTATSKLMPAVSSMSPTTLQKIAKDMKLTYRDRNQGGPVSEVYQASKAALAVDRSQRVVHYLNLYWLVAIPFTLLVFWEWQALVIKLFKLRGHHNRNIRGKPDGRKKLAGGQHA